MRKKPVNTENIRNLHLTTKITKHPLTFKNSTSVFKKNDGFTKLRQLSFVLTSSDGPVITEISRNPIVLSAYTHAPLTSVDLEGS